jgi:hypothetical protein
VCGGFHNLILSTVLLSLRHVADIVSSLLHVLTQAGMGPTYGLKYEELGLDLRQGKRLFSSPQYPDRF